MWSEAEGLWSFPLEHTALLTNVRELPQVVLTEAVECRHLVCTLRPSFCNPLTLKLVLTVCRTNFFTQIRGPVHDTHTTCEILFKQLFQRPPWAQVHGCLVFAWLRSSLPRRRLRNLSQTQRKNPRCFARNLFSVLRRCRCKLFYRGRTAVDRHKICQTVLFATSNCPTFVEQYV
jgi:hypothetical protein